MTTSASARPHPRFGNMRRPCLTLMLALCPCLALAAAWPTATTCSGSSLPSSTPSASSRRCATCPSSDFRSTPTSRSRRPPGCAPRSAARGRHSTPPPASWSVRCAVRRMARRSPVSPSRKWTELSFTAGSVVRHAPRIMAITAENGWFALCDVPRGGLMLRVATRAPTVRRVSSSRRRTTNSCAASSRWAGAGASRWSAACARSPTATCSPQRSCASTADHRPAPTTAANSPSPRFAWSSQRAWQCSTRPR